MPKLDGTMNRKERQPARTCAKKKAYATPWDAVKSALSYFQQFKVWQSSYECLICGKIHLTTIPPTSAYYRSK